MTERALRRTGAAIAIVVALATAADAADHGPRVRVVQDVFTTTAHEVEQQRRAGATPVCAVRVGVWRLHDPDADRFPPRTRSGPTGGAIGERWLDLRAWETLRPMVADRLRLCREKGFDVVTLPGRDRWGGGQLTSAERDRFGARVEDVAAELGVSVTRTRS